MNHASKRWLHLLHISYLLIDSILLGGFLYLRFATVSPSAITLWAITPLIAILAGTHLTYGILVYPWLQKKNLWVAMMLSQTLFDFTIVALIETSAEVNNVYWVLLTLTLGISALLGVFAVVAEVIFDSTLFFLTILGFQTSSKASPLVEFFWLCAVYITGLTGWLFFRKFYEKESGEIDQVNTLNQLLKQEQQRSDLIIQSIADGVVVFDTAGKISIINAAAAALTEWPTKEAIGIDVRLVVKLMSEDSKPIPETDNIFNKVLAGRQYVSQTSQIVGRHTKTAIVSLVVSPILAANGSPVGAVAVFRDVTNQRQEEKQRAEFISTASHEMRTPVAAIEGYLALALNDKVSTIDTKAREYLEKAHESTQHLGTLFQDLLTSAKAEDGRLTSNPVVIEMGDFLEKLTESLRFVAEKKSLSVEFVIGNNDLIDATSGANGGHVVKPLYYAFADPDRIREVVINLFDNAVKYTDTGKISIGLTGNDSVVQFYVRDTGAGIPAGDVPHLFQKFYRVDNSSTRAIGGTGLGLFISRKIIELYKGRVWVESEVGKGSTFFINLPRLQSQKADELRTSEAAQSTLPSIASLSNS